MLPMGLNSSRFLHPVSSGSSAARPNQRPARARPASVARRAPFVLFWRTQWRLGLAVGFCVLFSYALVLWAMHLGSVAEAAALRELSVILVVLLGMRYLKEPFGGPRLLACGLVLAGTLVMKL